MSNEENMRQERIKGGQEKKVGSTLTHIHIDNTHISNSQTSVTLKYANLV